VDIEIWDGGLQEQEIEAINKIKAAFAEKPYEGNAPRRGASL